MRFYKNLYWQASLGCDTTLLAASCVDLDNWVMANMSDNPDPLPEHFHIYDVYNNYNFFAYPLPGVHALFEGICQNFSVVADPTDMWIKAWVNVYKPGMSHDWHHHKTHTWLDDSSYKVQHASWHGIYCVVGDDTCTTYKHTETHETVHIPWKDNQLALIENKENWLHRSWKPKQGQQRITVAFNIMHRESIDTFRYANHWMPVIAN